MIFHFFANLTADLKSTGNKLPDYKYDRIINNGFH